MSKELVEKYPDLFTETEQRILCAMPCSMRRLQDAVDELTSVHTIHAHLYNIRRKLRRRRLVVHSERMFLIKDQ